MTHVHHQTITWNYEDALSIKPQVTKFNGILLRNQIFLFKIIDKEISSAKQRPFSPNLNVLSKRRKIMQPLKSSRDWDHKGIQV